jgi:hypothetical protein
MRIVLFTNDNAWLELVGDEDNVKFRLICPEYNSRGAVTHRTVTFSMKAAELVHQINLVANDTP